MSLSKSLSEKFRKCQESNPGQLGEKREHYLCVVPSQLKSWRWHCARQHIVTAWRHKLTQPDAKYHPRVTLRIKNYFVFGRIIRSTFSLLANDWLGWRRCRLGWLGSCGRRCPVNYRRLSGNFRFCRWIRSRFGRGVDVGFESFYALKNSTFNQKV